MKLGALLSGSMTAADLRAAAERADAEAKAASTRLAELTQQRLDGLLGDVDDKALDRVESQLRDVTRTRDRAELKATELWRRHGEAVEAERLATIDAIHAKGQAALDRATKLIRDRYPRLAKPIVELALELDDIEAEVAKVNRQLREAGDPRSIARIDDAARPAVHPVDRLGLGFTDVLALPDAVDRAAMLYPPQRRGQPMRTGRAA
jgi:hypothetical protein